MNLKNILLGIAIIILTIFVTFYGINTIFPKPAYDDYCSSGEFTEFGPYPSKVYPVATESNCTFSRPLQEAYDSCLSDRGQPVFNYDDKGCSVSLKECNYCQKNYDLTMKERSKKVFFV